MPRKAAQTSVWQHDPLPSSTRPPTCHDTGALAFDTQTAIHVPPGVRHFIVKPAERARVKPETRLGADRRGYASGLRQAG